MNATPHAQEADAVLRGLGADRVRGLEDADVVVRRRVHGANALQRQAGTPMAVILSHQFRSVIVWLLAGAAVASVLMGDTVEGAAIVVVLLINGVIGFATELRAARAMEALMRIARVRTRVRRGGAALMVDAQDIVPGDIVVLEAGDVVTADLRLITASGLEADESVLTGESVPVAKATAAVAKEAGIGDRPCMAFKGTAITRGAGEGVVVATGQATELGRISEMVQRAESEAAPLERRLDRLGQRMVWLTLALTAAMVGIGVLRGNPFGEMVQTGVALAVAAVPEGLPVVATLSLARGMWRMSARNAVIRRLSSVETLGATTVILTDKTGTLTENRMTVVDYLVDEATVAVSDGVFLQDGVSVDPAADPRLDWALRIGALCNTADLGDGSRGGGAGEPMEQALLAVAHAAGMSRDDLHRGLPATATHAFDPDRKMMATVHDDGGDGTTLVAVKGAPESVLAASTAVMGADGTVRPLDPAAKGRWRARAHEAAGDGLRLLALAMKRGDGADPYAGLVLVGLVCLRDPLRADVAAAIAAGRGAGLRVVMMTGDHAETARAIAKSAGLGDGDLIVVEGADLAGLATAATDPDQRVRLLSADVFARVAPETKLALVSLFQKAGHVVAMTGDGVNDAPALKKADIGIAMGRRGTEVAKEAAHMVLRDDAFATIVVAIREGRVIFDNIRRFVVYLLSCNVSEVMVVGLAVGAGLPTPLLPLQILYLNLVTDVFPAFALGLGRGDDSVLQRPPRDPAEHVLTRAQWLQVVVLGGAITVATLGAFGLALTWLDLDPAKAVTVAFVTLALGQLWNVFNLRDPSAGPFRNDVTGNPLVWGALVLCLTLLALALWLPGLSDLLKLAFPGGPGLALAAVASIVPLLVGQLWLVAVKTRGRHGAGT